MAGEPAGFWSYVHADDDAEGGRILSLASRLAAAYRLLTAEDLQLFRDRDDVRWGDEWRSRIDQAIAGTTFFLPILTPSYFTSQECRRELLKFTAEAKRLGLEQLIMPIYWAPIPELDRLGEDAADEAIALVARYQWQDFREARLEDEGSSTFRKAVYALATEIARRVEQITQHADDLPAGSTMDGEPERDGEVEPPQGENGEPAEEEPGLIEL